MTKKIDYSNLLLTFATLKIYLPDMTDSVIIPLNGLPVGSSEFSWQVGKEFFEAFGNSEILDADLSVQARVEKSGSYLGVDLDIEGRLTVACDRCLENLDMPVGRTVLLSIKFGAEPTDEDAQIGEGERETVYLPADGGDIDLSQIVYDYAVLALPMQRVHPAGGCNPAAARWLSSEEEMPAEPKETQDSPFAALKGLFDDEKQ